MEGANANDQFSMSTMLALEKERRWFQRRDDMLWTFAVRCYQRLYPSQHLYYYDTTNDHDASCLEVFAIFRPTTINY